MYDTNELIKIYKRREGIAGETAEALEHLKNYETGPTFTAEDVRNILIEHGQKDHQFKLGETIKYSPTDIYDILKEVSK
jgi:hypothetical protein